MFSVDYFFLLNITYVFAIITCLGFLVFDDSESKFLDSLFTELLNLHLTSWSDLGMHCSPFCRRFWTAYSVPPTSPPDHLASLLSAEQPLSCYAGKHHRFTW